MLRARTCEGAAENGIIIWKISNAKRNSAENCSLPSRPTTRSEYSIWNGTEISETMAMDCADWSDGSGFFSVFALLRHWLSWLHTNRAHYSIFLNETRITKQQKNKNWNHRYIIIIGFAALRLRCLVQFDWPWPFLRNPIQCRIDNSERARARAREPKSNLLFPIFLSVIAFEYDANADDDGVDDGLSVSGVRLWPCCLQRRLHSNNNNNNHHYHYQRGNRLSFNFVYTK